MKIAIISDTHDNLPNFKKAVSFTEKEKIKLLIHCGDIFSPKTLKECLKDFSGKTHIVLSDQDEFYFKKFENNYFKNFPFLKIWKNFGEIEINNKKIIFTHTLEKVRNLIYKKNYDIIFFGHSHKPEEKNIKKTKIVNPGNLAGIFYKATFAIYKIKNNQLELKILEKIN